MPLISPPLIVNVPSVFTYTPPPTETAVLPPVIMPPPALSASVSEEPPETVITLPLACALALVSSRSIRFPFRSSVTFVPLNVIGPALNASFVLSMFLSSVIVPPELFALLTASVSELIAALPSEPTYSTSPAAAVLLNRYMAVPPGTRISYAVLSEVNMLCAFAAALSVTGMSPSPSVSSPPTPMLAAGSSPPVPTAIVCPDARYTLLAAPPDIPVFPVICTAPLAVNVPLSTYTPPPPLLAVLPLMVPPLISNAPPASTYTPPPLLAVLPLMVPPSIVNVPPFT